MLAHLTDSAVTAAQRLHKVRQSGGVAQAGRQVFKDNAYKSLAGSRKPDSGRVSHLATRRLLINRRAAETNCELISKLPRNKVSAK